MSLQPGKSVLVQYEEDEQPELWQERVLVAHILGQRWLAATPDRDLVEVDLASLPYRVMGHRRALPAGLEEEDCYLISEPEQANGFC